MTRTWQLQEAKNKLSEVVARAETEGPQTITRHGVAVAVVVAADAFRRNEQPSSLADFFAQSPLRGVDLDLERDTDVGRDVDL
ncbi:MAG: type II toxin-antitoxin system prevent-host-death family antitoxin [Deltaproteobacteria bacterium]|nr:MAG: type II toxin-antitoxin system prevent-host-death family antitoxin [Deltaproteobacteria bacterium]